MTVSDKQHMPPASPHAFCLIARSPILERELELVYSSVGLAYVQYDATAEDPKRNWRGYSMRDYPSFDAYVESMSGFFDRLELSGWEIVAGLSPFIIELDSAWATDLGDKKCHHKVRDAFAKYRAAHATVDTDAESVVV